MKRKNACYRWAVLLAMMLVAAVADAQGWRNHSDYRVERGRVYYRNQPVEYADARTFMDLGQGYAKDCQNVYMEGRVLPYVDPASFRLKGQGNAHYDGYPDNGYGSNPGGNYGNRPDSDEHLARGYKVTQWNVYYNGQKTELVVRSFQNLGGGYAKDAFDVYYCGMKLPDAFANRFVYLGDGYAEDSFNTYYRGRKTSR